MKRNRNRMIKYTRGFALISTDTSRFSSFHFTERNNSSYISIFTLLTVYVCYESPLKYICSPFSSFKALCLSIRLTESGCVNVRNIHINIRSLLDWEKYQQTEFQLISLWCCVCCHNHMCVCVCVHLCNHRRAGLWHTSQEKETQPAVHPKPTRVCRYIYRCDVYDLRIIIIFRERARAPLPVERLQRSSCMEKSDNTAQQSQEPANVTLNVRW